MNAARDFQLPGRSAVYAPEGMAATSHPLSTAVALDTLKAGGNALDAAIAACAVQCVVEPQSTGIGGDCFCLYAPSGTDRVLAYNGSGKAPMAATVDYFAQQQITSLKRPSAHSVVIPGAVDAWCRLNADHGELPLVQLLEPAAVYARDGYPLTPRVQRDIAESVDILSTNEASRALFLPNGDVPPVGYRHKQPQLAETLMQIGRFGRDAFYSGRVASDIVDTLRGLGGLHTLDDFESATGDYVAPVSTNYRGRVVHQCPPNGQGVISLLLLNMISHAPLGNGPLTIDRVHTEIEACRLAYAARNRYIGDPRFSDLPLDQLLSADYARDMYARIDMQSANSTELNVDLPAHRDTVYISVVDKNRNACSFINTLFWPFGSGIMAPESGVLLTNRAESFVLDSDHPNCIAPGKRPLHTIIPGMVTENGRVVLSFGVMGGDYQAMGHMQFLTRYLDYGFDIQQAQDLPRFMADPVNGEVSIEHGMAADIRDALAARGHRLVDAENPIGGSQAVAIDWQQGILAGGSDPRKDGCALGY